MKLFWVPLRPAVQVFIMRRWHLGEPAVNHLRGASKHGASNHSRTGDGQEKKKSFPIRKTRRITFHLETVELLFCFPPIIPSSSPFRPFSSRLSDSCPVFCCCCCFFFVPLLLGVVFFFNRDESREIHHVKFLFCFFFLSLLSPTVFVINLQKCAVL